LEIAGVATNQGLLVPERRGGDPEIVRADELSAFPQETDYFGVMPGVGMSISRSWNLAVLLRVVGAFGRVAVKSNLTTSALSKKERR
jgi:hypothetical protein